MMSSKRAQRELLKPGFALAPGLASELPCVKPVVSSSAAGSPSLKLAAKATMDESDQATSQAAYPISGCMVRVNVGGELFVVHRDTLLGHRSPHSLDRSDANFFSRLIAPEAGAAPSYVDASGAILVDRDPFSFSIILNYLRGYENALILPDSVKKMVAQDAEYYHLEGLAQRLSSARDEDTSLLFLPGPGIGPERRRFKPTFGVNFVGDRFLVRGRHRISFEVLGREYLGIGVVSDACVAQDMEFHRTTNCCVYYMSGVFYSVFPSPRKEEGCEIFDVGDVVELLLDMDAKLLTFMFRDVRKVVSVKTASRLRFAVAAKRKSTLRIVEYTSEA